MKVDEAGTSYLEPTIKFPMRNRKSPSISNGAQNVTVSLLPSCHSIGIVADPRGYEKLVAFGKVPGIATGNEDEEEDDGEWNPDWMIVSDVLRGGTARRLMAESSDTIESVASCESAKRDQ